MKLYTVHIIATVVSYFIGVAVAFFKLHFSLPDSAVLALVLVPIWFVFYRYLIQVDDNPQDRTSKLPITSGEGRQ